MLFTNGWLHRDVSIGNITLMEEGEVRKPVKEYAPCSRLGHSVHVLGSFDVTADITECFGFICDGDQAVRWDIPNRTLASRRSVWNG